MVCMVFWCPADLENEALKGKIEAVRYARQNKIPFLGICLGLQIAVIEYARHVAGIEGATSEEFPTQQQKIAVIPRWNIKKVW